jgi:hypothetical protein
VAKKKNVNPKDKNISQRPDNGKILYVFSAVNLFLWILSINNVGYNFFKSLTGEGRFSDFTLSIYYSPIFFDPRILEAKPPFDYAMTPPLALFFRTIGWENWQVIFWGMNILSILVIGFILNKFSLLTKNFPLILLNCFPIFFCVMRGSADLWLLALLTLFYWLYQNNSSLASSLILGFLIASKPHFASFALLFWVRKDLRSIFTSAVSFLVFFVGSLHIRSDFQISDQLRVISQLSRNYHNTYAVGDGGLMWDNGLIGISKAFLYTLFQPENGVAADYGRMANSFQLVFSILMLITVLTVYWKKTIPLEEVWLMSTIFFIFLSPVSATYRLIFFIPVFCYYYFKINDKKLIFLMLLLWVPKALIWVKTTHGTEFVGDSLFNPVILFLIYLRLLRPRLSGFSFRHIAQSKL